MARLGPTHQLSVNIPYELYQAMHTMISEGKATSLRGIVQEGIQIVTEKKEAVEVS